MIVAKYITRTKFFQPNKLNNMRKSLLIIMTLLLTGSLFAQQSRTVSGSVTTPDGEPVVGATVIVLEGGGKLATITSVTGDYSIDAPVDGTLRFSSVGLVSQDIAIDGKKTIDVVLEADTKLIEEVVIAGYGSAKKVGSTVGSFSQINGKELLDKPSNNVMDGLQGRVAGLTIISGSGELDAASTIRLHGMGSISGGNEPLILLDGAAISSQTLMSINQNDIANITVLKDASATSIYGSRAANGVIYVTSKKGYRNEKTKVTVRTQYSMSNPNPMKIKGMTTEQAIEYNTELSNAIYGEEMTADEWLEIYGIDKNVHTDWAKEIYRKNAPMIQTDLSVSGGTKNTSYYFSGNFSDQTGILPGSTNTRYTFRTNIETQATKWLKAGFSLGLGYNSSSNAFSANSENGVLWFTNPATAMITVPSYQEAYDENGEPIGILDFADQYASPLVMHKYFPLTKNRLQMNGNIFLEATPVKGLTLRSSLSGNGFDYRRTTSNSPEYYWSGGVGSSNERFQRNYDWTITNTAEYKFSIAGSNNITLLAGHESIYGNTHAFGVGMKGIRDSHYLNIGKGTELTEIPYYNQQEYAYNSVFGRIEYNFAEKYFIDLSLRNDASSRFGAENRNALFYSAGLMWNAKKESFLKDVKEISQLSVKVSYGTSGNSDIGNYDQYALYKSATYGGTNGWVLDTDYPGNPALGWEKQGLISAGLTIGLFDRVSLTAEFYDRTTRDLLQYLPNAGTSGYTEILRNVGKMRNTGVDLTLDATLYSDKDWYVGFRTTFNYNKNQMCELWDDVTSHPIWSGDGRMEVGQPYGVYYMYEYRGVNPENGMPQWTDGDGNLTEDIYEAELINTGKSMLPPFTGGFGIDVSWKGIGLTADFSWVAGNYLLNNTLYFTENAYFAGWLMGQSTGALDYWKKPGDHAKYPRLDYAGNYGMEWDSHVLEDASFLRLKNIQVSYTFPQALMKKTGFISGAKVFVGARNLFTVTKYTGLDPEIDNGGPWALDDYPNSRQVTFGLELTF